MTRRRAALQLLAAFALIPASAWGQSAFELLERLGGATPLAIKASNIRFGVRDTVTQARMDMHIAAVIERCLPAVVWVKLAHASGSGFVIRPSGLLVTNAHVVEGVGLGGSVELQWVDGSREFGTVVGFNEPEQRDLAFVQINRNAAKTRSASWPHLEVADADSLGLNHPVLALGAPQGLPNTATFGHVSSLDSRAGPALRFIQIDADINPGNSGGPLIDLNGRIVGVNARIHTTTQGSAGVGFAIPSALLHKSLQQFDATYDPNSGTADIRGGWLGASFTFVRDFGRARDLQVESVQSGGPAYRAGLREGDVIVSVLDVPVPRTTLRAQFRVDAAVLELAPGDRLRLSIRRGTRERQIEIELGTEPNPERPSI